MYPQMNLKLPQRCIGKLYLLHKMAQGDLAAYFAKLTFDGGAVMKKILTLPPHYVGILGACCITVINVVIECIGWESSWHPRYINNQEIVILSIAVLLCSCIYHVFYEDCVTMCLFGIPLRRIPYSKISGAVWIRRNNSKGMRIHSAVLLTLSPYELSDKVVEMLGYQRRNLFRTQYVLLPPLKDDECISVIKACIGDVPQREIEYS